MVILEGKETILVCFLSLFFKIYLVDKELTIENRKEMIRLLSFANSDLNWFTIKLVIKLNCSCCSCSLLITCAVISLATNNQSNSIRLITIMEAVWLGGLCIRHTGYGALANPDRLIKHTTSRSTGYQAEFKVFLTIIPRAQMGLKSIAHEAKG